MELSQVINISEHWEQWNGINHDQVWAIFTSSSRRSRPTNLSSNSPLDTCLHYEQTESGDDEDNHEDNDEKWLPTSLPTLDSRWSSRAAKMWLACSGASFFSPCSCIKLSNCILCKPLLMIMVDDSEDWWWWSVTNLLSWITSAILVKSWSLRKTFPEPEARKVRFLEIAEDYCFDKI